MLPRILNNYNMIAQGRGFAGRVDEIELPKLKIKTDEQRSGGTDVPEDIDMGMEKLECSFTLAEHDPVIFKTFGLRSGSAVQLTFKAAMVDDDSVTPYVVQVRGRYTELDPGTLKAGDKTPLKATVAVNYYRLDQGDENLVEIDVRGMKRIIGGVDQLAAIRNAISA